MSTTWESITSSDVETLEFSSNIDINRKVNQVAKGLEPNLQQMFIRFPTEQDKELVADFLLACMHQENIAIKSKKVYITSLYYLSKYLGFEKPFRDYS